jgi:hypothetical protein
MRHALHVAAVVLILGQAGLAAAEEAAPAHQTVDLKVTAAGPLKWTPAPDGLGEFILNNVYVPLESGFWKEWGFRPFEKVVRSGDDEYFGTFVALMRRTGQGPWQIVPALYGRRATPVLVDGRTLWLDEWTRAYPLWQKGLVGLDLDTQKIVAELPGTKGWLIRIDNGEFLCLASTASDLLHGKQTLVAYNAKGEEVWRHAFGERLTVGVPFITPEATWAMVGRSPFIVTDAMPPPPTMFRIDVTTREMKEVSDKFLGYGYGGERQTEAVYDRGAILQLIESRQAEGGSRIRIHEIDCRTLETRDGPDVAVNEYKGNVRVTGDVVWALGKQPLAFSRKTLGPLDPKEAGRPPDWPPAQPAAEPTAVTSLGQMVAGIGPTLWMSRGGAALSVLTDTGDLARVDLPDDVAGRLKPAVTPQFAVAGRQLCLGASGVVVTADLAARKATLYSYSGPGTDYTGYSLAGGGDDSGLWIYAPYALAWLDFRKASVTLLDVPLERYPTLWHKSVAGNQIVALSDGGNVFRVTGPTGKVDVVGSWYKLISADPNDPRRAYQDSQWLSSNNIRRVYLTPDGWLGVVAPVPGENPGRSYGVFFLDVATGAWHAGDEAWTDIVPIHRGDALYGASLRQVWEWKDHKWSPVADLPPVLCDLGLSTDIGSGYRAVATDEYFYATTPIGLYRVRWADLLKQPTH